MFVLAKGTNPTKKKKPWHQGFTSSFLVNQYVAFIPKVPNPSPPKTTQFKQVHPVSQSKKVMKYPPQELAENFQFSTQDFDELFSLKSQPHPHEEFESSFFKVTPSVNGINNLEKYHSDCVALTGGVKYSTTKSEFAPIYFPSYSQ